MDKTDRKRVLVSLRHPFETKEKAETWSQGVPRVSRTKLLLSQNHFMHLLSKAVLSPGLCGISPQLQQLRPVTIIYGGSEKRLLSGAFYLSRLHASILQQPFQLCSQELLSCFNLIRCFKETQVNLTVSRHMAFMKMTKSK